MKITRIKENSLAQEIGLSSGDRLLKINGERVLDHLDYEFRIADENVILDVQINGVLSQMEMIVSFALLIKILKI